MYSSSPRLKKPIQYGTPESLGPNAYILGDTYTKRSRYYTTFEQYVITLLKPAENVVPFLSTSERSFAIGRTTFTDAIYNADSKHRIRVNSITLLYLGY